MKKRQIVFITTYGILACVPAILKINGVVDWTWAQVVSPFLAVVFLLFLFLFACFIDWLA